MAKGLTNNTNGPRAINTAKGAVVLQPGETLGEEHEVSDADRAALKATGFLDGSANSGIEPANMETARGLLNDMAMGEKPKPAGKPDGQTADELEKNNSKDQLVEIAQTEGVEVKDGATKAEIAQAIVDKRAAG